MTKSSLCKRIRDGHCGRVSSRIFHHIRECIKTRYGTLCLWTYCHSYPQRWFAAYYLHAMRSDSFFADAKAQIQQQSFQRYLVPRFTSYRPVTDDKQSFTALSQSLAESEIRNNLIIEDVLNVVAAGRTPIILTARTSHVELLAEMLKQHVANIIQLTGEGTAKTRKKHCKSYRIYPKMPLL